MSCPTWQKFHGLTLEDRTCWNTPSIHCAVRRGSCDRVDREDYCQEIEEIRGGGRLLEIPAGRDRWWWLVLNEPPCTFAFHLLSTRNTCEAKRSFLWCCKTLIISGNNLNTNSCPAVAGGYSVFAIILIPLECGKIPELSFKNHPIM